MREIDEVRRAKERLKHQIKDRPWYRGIGIAPHADGPVIRLNVAANEEHDEIPADFEGIPVEIVRIDAYSR